MARAPRQTGSRDRIVDIALGILKKHPDGIGFSELVGLIKAKDGKLNVGTVPATVAGLELNHGDKVYKPERGFYRLVEFRDASTGELKKDATSEPQKSIKETEFYQSFANWLVNDTEECTEAEPVGGKSLGSKWGTPDVIGIRKPKGNDFIRFDTEIVSAEIKTDTNQLITAFGQACAYSLFSHKVYLVIPRLAPPEDISRLDRLCQGYGIGMVLFDADKKPSEKQTANYTIRVRPKKHQPDMIYSNGVAAELAKLNKLFK